jgi:hypothetical protein
MEVTKARAGLAVVVVLLVSTLTAVVTTGVPASESGDAAGPVAVAETRSSTVRPESEAELAPAAPVSRAELERLNRRLEARREAASGNTGAGQPRGGSNTPETQIRDDSLSEANLVTRNTRNTRATAVSSTLAEPAAANDATPSSADIFYGGNTYHSRSINRGSTWVNDGAIPAGPAEAPTACCDLDAVHHGGLDTTFHSVLYINSAVTNGVVRIFVRRGNIADGPDCFYDINPSGTTTLPDYPHLAVSNNFLYLSQNNISSGSTWTGAQVRRFGASQMANCQSTTTNTFTYTGGVGQRILTPVENASTTMYFGSNQSANSFRLFRWPESSTTISDFLRPLSHGSNFSNPDCRGGTGNFDYIERSTSWSISGFRMRGAVRPGSRVWFVWNVAKDASHTQAHLHSAIFTDAATPATLASPPVFNQTNCIGFPSLGANSFGEFGLTVAMGGNKEAGGTAAQGFVGVDDSGSAGNTFPALTRTAAGTHNRSDARYGDYFTIRRNDKCPTFGWVATNYALLNGNTSPANVNARYIELQSGTRAACP